MRPTIIPNPQQHTASRALPASPSRPVCGCCCRAHFPPVSLTAYYAGGSLSGLLPGLIVLAQGANGQPYCADVTDEAGRSVRQLVYPSARFGPSVFFVVLSAMTLVSLLAFLALGAFHKQQQQQPQRRRSRTPQSLTADGCDGEGGVVVEEEEGVAPDEVLVHWSCSGGEVDVDCYRPCPPHEPQPASAASSPSSASGAGLGRGVGWLLCVIGVINGLANGVLPSVQVGRTDRTPPPTHTHPTRVP